MVQPNDIPGDRARRRNKWAILGSFALLIATILIGIWLAFTVKVETTVTTDPQNQIITIEGPESDFAGVVTGSYEGYEVTISGLPSAEPLIDNPRARRALCALREDEAADWSQATHTLRGHLASEKIDKLCAPFS